MSVRKNKESKYWSNMYVTSDQDNTEQPNSDNTEQTNSRFVISTDPPIKYEDDKKVKLYRGIKESEYQEVSSFYQKYNDMSTGNTTLLPVKELKRYLAIENISILMRSSNGMLVGTIICLMLPVKNKNDISEEVIMHGCTTFLAVHPALRGLGLCMALIRGLIEYGYEDGYYCDYHMVAFKIGTNSIPINSWYRPINLNRAKELGFLYDGHKDPRNSTKVRLKYRTKLPNNHRYVQVSPDNKNINTSLEYYKGLVQNRNFAFWPDEPLWALWVKSFPTYLIYKGDNEVGIISINTVYCVIKSREETGKIVFPIICEGNMGSVMLVLCNISYKLKYDVIYFHQHGDVTEKALESINSIKTTTKLWFSLYNNRIKIQPEDIHLPLL